MRVVPSRSHHLPRPRMSPPPERCPSTEPGMLESRQGHAKGGDETWLRSVPPAGPASGRLIETTRLATRVTRTRSPSRRSGGALGPSRASCTERSARPTATSRYVTSWRSTSLGARRPLPRRASGERSAVVAPTAGSIVCMEATGVGARRPSAPRGRATAGIVCAALLASLLAIAPARPAHATTRVPGSTSPSGRGTWTGPRWRRRQRSTSSCGRRSGTRRRCRARSTRSISSTWRAPPTTTSSSARTTVPTLAGPTATRRARPTTS